MQESQISARGTADLEMTADAFVELLTRFWRRDPVVSVKLLRAWLGLKRVSCRLVLTQAGMRMHGGGCLYLCRSPNDDELKPQDNLPRQEPEGSWQDIAMPGNPARQLTLSATYERDAEAVVHG